MFHVQNMLNGFNLIKLLNSVNIRYADSYIATCCPGYSSTSRESIEEKYENNKRTNNISHFKKHS